METIGFFKVFNTKMRSFNKNRSFTISKSKFWHFVHLVIFRLVLDAFNIFVLSVNFSYLNYAIHWGISNYLISWGVYLLLANSAPPKLTRVSDFYSTFFICVLAGPITSLYGLDMSRSFVPLFAMTMSYFIIFSVSRLGRKNFGTLPKVKNGKVISCWIAAVGVFSLLVWYPISGATLNLDVLKIYEYRQSNAELSAFGFLAYSNTWIFKVLNPFLIAIALYHRRYFAVGLLFFIQLIFFGYSTHRMVVLLPFLVTGVWFFFRNGRSATILPVVSYSLIVFVYLVFLVFSYDLLASILGRRLFFSPASLVFSYFEFINQNVHVFWSHSFLASVLDYPFDKPLPLEVGAFNGKPNVWANAGYLATGYAHAGLWGVVIYSLILGLLFRFLLDPLSRTTSIWFLLCLTITPIFTIFTTTDIPTVFVSHGLGLAMILLYFSAGKA